MTSTSSALPQIMITRENSDTPAPLATCTTRNGQCTHHTMTRVYNPHFRCTMCLQHGPFGWLYRCTQDRELIIEHDLQAGHQRVKLDQLHSILSPIRLPRKRSPEARTSSILAFFDEVSYEDLQSYAPGQISIILRQRGEVSRSRLSYALFYADNVIRTSHVLQPSFHVGFYV
jgi:hypothetical protein